ncbi:MAG: hypothetical protein L6R39_003783 [Caloplaca ligustica]|nr:MAG: hypothetical protein L6R39_003783 [Caloplaca ligustica]
MGGRHEPWCGEAQLSTFLAGTNTRGAKKTCAGTVQDGDFWQIAFDLTNADQGAVQHCANPSACGGDSYQFHMTVKNGPLDFPYNPSAMNHYTLDGTGKDILQCSVAVHRQGDRAFNVYVYDNSGTQKGMGALSAFANGGTITVTGLPQGLKFTRVGLFAASGAGMSFTYMSTPAFSWFGDTKGSSTTFLADGSYCSVTNTGTAVQDLKCYFPCPAA